MRRVLGNPGREEEADCRYGGVEPCGLAAGGRSGAAVIVLYGS